MTYIFKINAATENNSNACAVKGGNHSTATENRYHIINVAKPESHTRGNQLMSEKGADVKFRVRKYTYLLIGDGKASEAKNMIITK